MPGDFLGVGWAFPFTVNEGQVQLSEYEESVRDAIWILLGTSKGERAMRPEFGSGLNDLVFSLHNASTVGQIAFEVRQTLDRWEPRIRTLAIDVLNGDQPGVLEIRIECRILQTNTRMNLVYPFYLNMVRGTV